MASNLFQMQGFANATQRIRPQRGLAFGIIILTALLAFELFNYSTTEFALTDLLGDLEFMQIHWATILAIAFCGIDFAGIARLFTPEQDNNKPGEAWYLFGAWLLAATMNAMLTWWGVSLAVLGHQTLGNAVIERQTLLQVVPIFVAVMVWLIRVLIIGSFSVAGDRIFSQSDSVRPSRPATSQPRIHSNPAAAHSLSHQTRTQQAYTAQPVRRSNSQPVAQAAANLSRPEPTYHSLSMSPARPANAATGMHDPISRNASQIRR